MTRRARSTRSVALTGVAAVPVAAMGVVSTYLAVLTLAAWRAFVGLDSTARRTPSLAVPTTSFTILVPAHDEERLIADTVDHLLALDYPSEMFDVNVVADHCGDATAEIAGHHGATVLENADPAASAARGRRWAGRSTGSTRRKRSETSLCSSTPTHRLKVDLLRAFDRRFAAGCGRGPGVLRGPRPCGDPGSGDARSCAGGAPLPAPARSVQPRRQLWVVRQRHGVPGRSAPLAPIDRPSHGGSRAPGRVDPRR